MKKILDYLFRKLKLQSKQEENKEFMQITVNGYGKTAAYITKNWDNSVLQTIVKEAKEKGIILGWIEFCWVNKVEAQKNNITEI